MQYWLGSIRRNGTVSIRTLAITRERIEVLGRKRVRKVRIRGEESDSPSSFSEALRRVAAFKHYVENQDGYRLINKGDGLFADEKDVQTYFGLAWVGTVYDVNREPNNGRGPVDFKISNGAADKTLIEFKLGSNRQLRRNLAKQVEVYEAANQTEGSVKVIVCYTAKEAERVRAILSDLQQADAENVVLIDARSDNKPSASRA